MSKVGFFSFKEQIPSPRGEGENAYVRTLRENTIGSNLTNEAFFSLLPPKRRVENRHLLQNRRPFQSSYSFGLSGWNIRQSLSNILSWKEHSSILEQRLELETGDRDRCVVLLVLKLLNTVETGVEEEETCVGLMSRETGVGNDS
ncbi:unnamed protein product [Prunus armeniaca]